MAHGQGAADALEPGHSAVQPFLDMRTTVLNDTLEDAFRRRYSGFRPVNDDEATPAAA